MGLGSREKELDKAATSVDKPAGFLVHEDRTQREAWAVGLRGWWAGGERRRRELGQKRVRRVVLVTQDDYGTGPG